MDMLHGQGKMMQSMEKKMNNINNFIKNEQKLRRRQSFSPRANNTVERSSSEQQQITASSLVTRDGINSEDTDSKVEEFKTNPPQVSGEENEEQREILNVYGLPPCDSFGHNFWGEESRNECVTAQHKYLISGLFAYLSYKWEQHPCLLRERRGSLNLIWRLL